jgi:hypothetical protein
MTGRPHGKHVNIDPSNPEGLGICDKTGFVFRRRDLVKQKEWRGTALVDTGFLVGRPYLDEPNEQLRTPILPPDPVPAKLPRVMQQQQVTWSQGLGATWNNLNTYIWNGWGSFEDGTAQLSPAAKLASLQNFNWGAG